MTNPTPFPVQTRTARRARGGVHLDLAHEDFYFFDRVAILLIFSHEVEDRLERAAGNLNLIKQVEVLACGEAAINNLKQQ